MVGEPMLHDGRFRERPWCWPIVSRSVTLPTVAMAAAAATVPTFSWTYKAGQWQQPLLLCLEHFSRRGHLGRGAPPTSDWGCHFSQLSNGQGHRRGRGGGSTFLWTWGHLYGYSVAKEKGADGFPPMVSCKMKIPLCKLSHSAEGSAEEQNSYRIRHHLLCVKTTRHRL